MATLKREIRHRILPEVQRNEAIYMLEEEVG